MQVTFLFWNVYRQPLEARVARIAAAHSVDVVMLAECETAPSAVLDALNSVNVGAYCFPGSFSRRIKIFTRFPATSLIDQMTLRRSKLRGICRKVGLKAASYGVSPPERAENAKTGIGASTGE